MMEAVWWIREIDWRISSGVIFFIQLVLWNREEEKRRSFPVRIFLSLTALCGVSWCIRYVLEEWVTVKLCVALGYSVYVMVLSLVFIACHRLCYRAPWNVAIFNSVIALTVYRMAWDAVKLISGIPVGTDEAWTNGSPIQSVMSYLLYLVLIMVCYEVSRHFVKRPASFPARTYMLFVVVLLSQMLLEFTYQFFDDGKSGLLFFLTAFLYCLVNFILLMMVSYLATLQEENVTMQNFIRSKQQYYEISREGILSLQIKCHDLKHQIAMIRSAEGQRQLQQYIRNLSDTIDEYNTVVNSGNKDVDVVLTEKNIICSINGIRFTYILDGQLFSFLTDMEIFSLFGNAMDNAIEGMDKVACPEKKFISLKANKCGDMVVFMVENYFEQDLKFQNGMPVTTKEEARHHGFGLRSIMEIAKEHGGSVSVQAENNIFRLVVSLRPN